MSNLPDFHLIVFPKACMVSSKTCLSLTPTPVENTRVFLKGQNFFVPQRTEKNNVVCKLKMSDNLSTTPHLETINNSLLPYLETKSKLKASTTIINRNGERGSACRIPIEALNNLDSDPLTNMEKVYSRNALLGPTTPSMLKLNLNNINQ